MEPLRYVTDADLRFSSSGRIVAAPLWAYELSRALPDRFRRIDELWLPWWADRKRLADARRAASEDLFEECVRIVADPGSDDNARLVAQIRLRAFKEARAWVPSRPAASLDYPG